ncbi:MAG: transposase [Firmicutes bacterium]|nr:transposase [Bacillota bacterium]
MTVAKRFYPSSKTCCGCGVVRESLALCEPALGCAACGVVRDRDRNAGSSLGDLGDQGRLPGRPRFRGDARRSWR